MEMPHKLVQFLLGGQTCVVATVDAEGLPCESLWKPSVEPCVPFLSFHGGRGELRSRLRSMASIVIDRRQRLDVIRDDLEHRGLQLARAA